jgi:hypothetical protein
MTFGRRAEHGQTVIVIGVLALSVILVMVALRAMPGGFAPRLRLAIATMPLLLTIWVAVPSALALGGQMDWAHEAAVTVSRVGVALSFVLLTIGAALTLRAALADDRRAAVRLALETVLAGLPAGVVTVYAALARLL